MRIQIICYAENEYECDDICKIIDEYFHFKELKEKAGISATGYHWVNREYNDKKR